MERMWEEKGAVADSGMPMNLFRARMAINGYSVPNVASCHCCAYFDEAVFIILMETCGIQNHRVKECFGASRLQPINLLASIFNPNIHSMDRQQASETS